MTKVRKKASFYINYYSIMGEKRQLNTREIVGKRVKYNARYILP